MHWQTLLVPATPLGLDRAVHCPAAYAAALCPALLSWLDCSVGREAPVDLQQRPRLRQAAMSALLGTAPLQKEVERGHRPLQLRTVMLQMLKRLQRRRRLCRACSHGAARSAPLTGMRGRLFRLRQTVPRRQQRWRATPPTANGRLRCWPRCLCAVQGISLPKTLMSMPGLRPPALHARGVCSQIWQNHIENTSVRDRMRKSDSPATPKLPSPAAASGLLRVCPSALEPPGLLRLIWSTSCGRPTPTALPPPSLLLPLTSASLPPLPASNKQRQDPRCSGLHSYDRAAICSCQRNA